MIIINHVIFI